MKRLARRERMGRQKGRRNMMTGQSWGQKRTMGCRWRKLGISKKGDQGVWGWEI